MRGIWSPGLYQLPALSPKPTREGRQEGTAEQRLTLCRRPAGPRQQEVVTPRGQAAGMCTLRAEAWAPGGQAGPGGPAATLSPSPTLSAAVWDPQPSQGLWGQWGTVRLGGRRDLPEWAGLASSVSWCTGAWGGLPVYRATSSRTRLGSVWVPCGLSCPYTVPLVSHLPLRA